MARTVKSRGSGSTPAVTVVARAGVDFVLHEYEAGPEGPASYGERVAVVLGVPSERVFKTLVTEIDGAPTVAVVPVSGLLNFKALARAVGGKRAAMADQAAAERATGYVLGGISPLGQRKRLPTVVDHSVTDHDTVFVSAGRRGAQLELRPENLLELCAATAAPIASPNR